MFHLKSNGKFAMFFQVFGVLALLLARPPGTQSIILPRLMPFFYQPFVTEPSQFSTTSLFSPLSAPLSASQHSSTLHSSPAAVFQYPAIHSQPDYHYNWNQYIQSQNPGILYPTSGSSANNNYHPQSTIFPQTPISSTGSTSNLFGSLLRKPWISWKLGKFGLRSPSTSTTICGPGSGGFSGSSGTSSFLFPSSSLVQSLIGQSGPLSSSSSSGSTNYLRPSNYPCYNPCCFVGNYHPTTTTTSSGTRYASSSSNRDYIQTNVNDSSGYGLPSGHTESHSYPVGYQHSNSPVAPNYPSSNYIYYSPESITSSTNGDLSRENESSTTTTTINNNNNSGRVSYKPAQIASLSGSYLDHSEYSAGTKSRSSDNLASQASEIELISS